MWGLTDAPAADHAHQVRTQARAWKNFAVGLLLMQYAHPIVRACEQDRRGGLQGGWLMLTDCCGRLLVGLCALRTLRSRVEDFERTAAALDIFGIDATDVIGMYR